MFPILRVSGVTTILALTLPVAMSAADPAAVAAPLVFEVTERVVEVGFLPRPFVVDFVFTTGGDQPVTIRNFTTSCPCTSVALDRKNFFPGQKGVITLLYDYRGGEAPEVQVIEVWTDRTERPQHLRIVPQTIEGRLWVERRELRWLSVAEHRPQTFDVEVAAGDGEQVPRIAVTSSAWNASIAPADRPGRYRITVVPTVDDAPAAQLLVQLDGPTHAKTPGTSGPAAITVELRPGR